MSRVVLYETRADARVASPFIGQGENCVLVRPYVKHMTDSEIHQALVSGFATIAGSVFIAYVSLGIPPKDLLTSSLMSIPASIALSKTMMPETRKPVTMGKAAVFEHDEATDGPKPYNALHAFSEGAWFGLRVAGLIFCNVLCIVSALYAVNGILAWVGQFWGIARSGPDSLSIQLIGGYILYPFTFVRHMELASTRADLFAAPRCSPRRHLARLQNHCRQDRRQRVCRL